MDYLPSRNVLHQNYGTTKSQPWTCFLLVIKIILQQNHSIIEVILWNNYTVSKLSIKPNQTIQIQRALRYRKTHTPAGHNRFYFGEGMPSLVQCLDMILTESTAEEQSTNPSFQ